MDLISHAFMPVRTHEGTRLWISPQQLSDSRIAAFDADRADFNGALAQFAIGLLQTSSPVDSAADWRLFLRTPPDEAMLRGWFAPHAGAFEFDGNGARFMQDFDLRSADGDPVGIAGLLIESPGENTIKNNSDHFIKRHQVNGLCPSCTALALFTLQTNAPAGGAGHRTGLRGGGPLTTLLLADGDHDGDSPRSLWQSLWLNVQQQQKFEASSGDATKTESCFTFPWTASLQKIQRDGGQTVPVQVHPAHMFWAMPRRIRIDFETTVAGVCDICNRETGSLVQRYVTKNYGLNYKGPWRHALSPYYESKEGMLPLHPQPGGLAYKHWLGWVLGMDTEKRKIESAPTIHHFLMAGDQARTGISLRLWAFGYDMDNMKPRCWYESTVPLYSLADCSVAAKKEIGEDIGAWLDGAELASSYLRGAVKDAWFGGEARGDFSFIDASFWSRTESGFYALLKLRIQTAREGLTGDSIVLTESWLSTLQRVVKQLFDADLVGAGQIERQNPARISKAHRQLVQSLNGPKLRTALALPVAAKPVKKSKSTATVAE